MKISDIDRFFVELNARMDTPLRILITGGAAAILFGGSRATQDIDFEVTFKAGNRKSTDLWPKLQKQLESIARSTGISPEYSDDIDRWSSIALPGKKSSLYKKIGKIEVRILDPGLWAIGKLTRCLDSDSKDLVDVLARVKSNPVSLATLWGKALGISPPSPSQSEFRRHVERFFNDYAAKIWGKKASPENLIEHFLKAARNAKPTSRG